MSGLEPVAYRDGETALTGLLARPAGLPRAAIVLFPTIANATAATERRAAMLAEAGYLTMIADFYGEPVESFAAAGPLAERLRATEAGYRQRIHAAIDALRSLSAARGLPVGAVGYCMGGQAALEAARSGADLAVAVSFHGLLDTKAPAEPGAIKARILVCHGDADPMVQREQVLRFWEEMDRAGANWHFHAYSGVRHGFTDPASHARGIEAVKYDASADRQSWSAMLSMFDEGFA
jgi:dienelactone hydrolase